MIERRGEERGGRLVNTGTWMNEWMDGLEWYVEEKGRAGTRQDEILNCFFSFFFKVVMSCSRNCMVPRFWFGLS